MPTENEFRNLLREHMRETTAGNFGQFEYAWKHEPVQGLVSQAIDATGTGATSHATRDHWGYDFAMEIRIDDGSPTGRAWISSDPLPEAEDFVSELSIKARSPNIPSLLAASWSPFSGNHSDPTDVGPQPFSASQTSGSVVVSSATKATLTLSEASAPPGNVDEADLEAEFVFNVVAVGSAFPDTVFGGGLNAGSPKLVVQVTNHSSPLLGPSIDGPSWNIESWFFNCPAAFRLIVAFTPREFFRGGGHTGTPVWIFILGDRWSFKIPL